MKFRGATIHNFQRWGVFGCLLAFGTFNRVQAIGFEAEEQYQAGGDISGVLPWTGSTKAAGEITLEDFKTGEQSLKILKSAMENAVVLEASVPANGIVFIDFAIRPTVDGSPVPLYTANVNGAILAFTTSTEGGTILTAKSDGGQAIETKYSFAIDDSNLALDWLRVTIREDLKAKTWDLYLDGKLTLINQVLNAISVKKVCKLSFYPNVAGDAYLDDVLITTDNPLFPDADKDGIPDAVEKANSYLSGIDDRDGDANHNGISNIEEFRRNGQSATRSLAVLYVDNTNGDDANTGALPYSSGEDGPLKTLLAAFQKANDTTTVAISPSVTPYDWPSNIPSHLKQINTLPLEGINIK